VADFYADLRDTATELIDEFGRDVTVNKFSRTAGVSAEPWRGPGDPGPNDAPTAANTVTVKAAILDFNASDVDGTIVRRGDKQAYISAETAGTESLEEYDTINDNNEIYKIVNVETIEPGVLGTSRVLYIMQLRR
jgi:hypothetical protein